MQDRAVAPGSRPIRDVQFLRAPPESEGAIPSLLCDDVDLFAVHCPETSGVYLIPIADLPTDHRASLRVDPPRNNQRKGIREASKYEIARIEATPLRAPRPQETDGAPVVGTG
jgi:hypothetical protein